MPKYEIKSSNPAIESQLKELENKNPREFATAGFKIYTIRKNEDVLHLYVMPFDTSATLGFKMGKGLLLRRMRKVFKKIDPNVEIKELKK